MGQKVNPVGMRIGISRDWNSKWYASNKDFSSLLNEDVQIRKYLNGKLKEALLSHIEIERANKESVKVLVFTARPGLVLGQDGENVKKITKELTKIAGGKSVKIAVVEVKNPALDANIVAQEMAKQLEDRASFRNVQKKTIQKVMKGGAVGVKTMISGRLAGADIARSEGYKEGVVSLHTLRMDVDYAMAEADTQYGKLGCKVWISRGEAKKNKPAEKADFSAKKANKPVEKKGE
ncbi:MAG: 30S ribosomal protein S3 [Bacilli bacterium]|nr:30S ribosomal protein S3 [Erysipelotrichaceae bacterium]MDD6249551.1 30S ribosomal protein S3 [Bacillales bacterium]MDY2746783.1 30S ribosomal protein S3 [Bacilli bacterium]MDD7382169.1 30S ribosomal protein S3 [Bacillales bacterium]MDY3890142.1 30S ribosomal protein S3 [Bacilli bacterium]